MMYLFNPKTKTWSSGAVVITAQPEIDALNQALGSIPEPINATIVSASMEGVILNSVFVPTRNSPAAKLVIASANGSGTLVWNFPKPAAAAKPVPPASKPAG